MSPDPFVPPPKPRYVDANGKLRQPSEFEVIEHKRAVIFAKAKHYGWGRHTGMHSIASMGNRLRVRMDFERGSAEYFVSAE